MATSENLCAVKIKVACLTTSVACYFGFWPFLIPWEFFNLGKKA